MGGGENRSGEYFVHFDDVYILVSTPCLSSLLPSSFIIFCLLTPDELGSLSKALVPCVSSYR